MKFSPVLILLATLVSAAAHSACVTPQAPSIPDGATANKEEIIASSQAVKTFMQEANGYLECLDQEQADAGEEEAPKAQLARTESYNGAVDSMQTVADAFNQARVTFLESNPQ